MVLGGDGLAGLAIKGDAPETDWVCLPLQLEVDPGDPAPEHIRARQEAIAILTECVGQGMSRGAGFVRSISGMRLGLHACQLVDGADCLTSVVADGDARGTGPTCVPTDDEPTRCGSQLEVIDLR